MRGFWQVVELVVQSAPCSLTSEKANPSS